MIIIQLIRKTRAISACTLIPHNPLLAITLSETVSYILPFINNSNSSTDIFFFTYYLFYDFNYTAYIVENYKNKYNFYYNIELFSIILYLIFTNHYI